MAADQVSLTKAYRKRHGLKKVFSVPVGKLRSKIVSPLRNGSSSRSGSRNASHHKILLRNNRDLARALSCEKLRFRGVVTENVNLSARLHETRLEVHGLEKQLSQCRQSLKLFQNSVKSHLRDAVKHSVSLTESLQLAMGLCFEEQKDFQNLRNTVSGCSVPTSSSQPLRLRVNPMVDGLTIRHPTISLRRVVMSSDNRVANENTPSENVADDNAAGDNAGDDNGADDSVADVNVADENVAPSEEESSETVEDISQSIEEACGRPGGLSTCLEEDEDCFEDANLNEMDSEEETDEENDSIRRKVVSFRNTTLEKDQSRSGLDNMSGKSNSPRETGIPTSMESCFVGQSPKQKCKSPKNDKKPKSMGKTYQSDEILKKYPIVALNDISKYLQNSNSVNVQKVILDLDSSKLRVQVCGRVKEEAANGKENIPKSLPKKKLSGKKSSVSSGVDSHFSSSAGELCSEGIAATTSLSGNEKLDSLANNGVPPTVNIPNLEEDPLEGTSWMHLNLFSESKSKTRKGDKKKPAKDSHHKTSECIKPKSNGGKVIDSSKEKSSDCLVASEAQGDDEILTNNAMGPTEEYDVSDFDVGLKHCPMAQSTPFNHRKPSKNSRTTNVSDVSKSSSKSSRSSSCNNSFVSDGSCSPGDNQLKEVDKNLVVPLIDSKLDSNAHVTVRIRKLNFPALSHVSSVNLPDLAPTNNVERHVTEVDNCANVLGDEMVNFLGFPASSDSEGKIELMKNILASECELTSRETSRSCGAESLRSVWSASVTRESQFFIESNCCEVSGENQGRPRRRAAPKDFKEKSLNKKMRRP